MREWRTQLVVFSVFLAGAFSLAGATSARAQTPTPTPIVGGAGNDVLIGNGNDNLLIGLNGADTYVTGFNQGDDIISDQGTDGAVDRLLFATVLDIVDNFLFQQVGDHLVLIDTTQPGSLTFDAWFTNPDNQIERMEFRDGAVVTFDQVADILANGGQTAFCGNAVVGAGEDCDDGNTEDGDCCSASCSFEASGSPCDDDGDPCNGDETCDGAGSCASGPALDCNDGRPCTQDSCDALAGCVNEEAPAPACIEGWEKGAVLVKEKRAGKEKLLVKMKKGPALSQADFGDPLAGGGSAYGVCVFDDAGTLVGEMLVDRAGDVCGSKDCWKSLGKQPPDGKGFLYKDKQAAADGIALIKMKGGDAGKSQLLVKGANNDGKGQAALPIGIAPALENATSATVQLVTDDACFSLTVDDIKKQDATLFKAIR